MATDDGGENPQISAKRGDDGDAVTAFENRKDALRTQIAGAQDASEAIAAVTMTLEQVACDLAQDERDDLTRQRQLAVLARPGVRHAAARGAGRRAARGGACAGACAQGAHGRFGRRPGDSAGNGGSRGAERQPDGRAFAGDRRVAFVRGQRAGAATRAREAKRQGNRLPGCGRPGA